MRQTELRPDRDGYYRRNIGWVRSAKTGRMSQPKLNLGTVKRAAQDRLEKIAAIWRRIEAEAGECEEKPRWDDMSLGIAKAIGDGRPDYRVEKLQEDDYQYVRFVAAVAKTYPEIGILPADEGAYRAGKEVERKLLTENEVKKQAILGNVEEYNRVVLECIGSDANPPDLLDRTLHQALDGYAEWIREEKFDKSEGAVNDTGMTRLNMVKQLKTYLIPNRPLSSLSDFAAVDQLFAVIRRRPVTFRYEKPMAKKTASNLIGELGRFFDWLHKSPDWDWRKPPEFAEISRSPFELESDVEVESKEVPTYTVAQLRTLFEYGTPLERLLILLGVNCAFGADQIGRLRIGEVIEKKGVHYIMRVRRKRKVRGIHRLFGATIEGLRWAMTGREDQKAAYVLVNGKGNPLWRKTRGGNRSRDIPNAWARLLDRVCEDHADFPRYGFNTLRDTSANMVRRLAGPEIASVHLTHRHQSSDRNLRRYTNVPRKKLFKTHRRLERKLATVFAVEDAWKDREHQYISRQTIKRIRGLHEQGLPVGKIAQQTGVSKATVYRWLPQQAEAKEMTASSPTEGPSSVISDSQPASATASPTASATARPTSPATGTT